MNKEEIMESKFDEIRDGILKNKDKYPRYYNTHISSTLNWKRYVKSVEFVLGLVNSDKMKILDLGCGDGHTTAMISTFLTESLVLGSDLKISESRRELLRHFKKYDCNFMISDSLKSAFKDESFDIVFSFGVMEHVRDDYEFLKEIYRILKTSGHNIIFNLPNMSCNSQNLIVL